MGDIGFLRDTADDRQVLHAMQQLQQASPPKPRLELRIQRLKAARMLQKAPNPETPNFTASHIKAGVFRSISIHLKPEGRRVRGFNPASPQNIPKPPGDEAYGAGRGHSCRVWGLGIVGFCNQPDRFLDYVLRMQ